MKLILIGIITMTIFSCKVENQKNIIQGDIYIKLIDVNNILYGLPENKIKEFKKSISNLEQNNFSNSEKKLMEYHKILIDNNLYKNPHFKLKLDSGKIINVYTDNTEYLKLKKELDSFDRDNQKIIVKFEGSKISDGIDDPDGNFDKAIYIAKQIISTEKTKGETDWAK
ncbi:hypothetical protein [Yeosuana sp. AK3]